MVLSLAHNGLHVRQCVYISLYQVTMMDMDSNEELEFKIDRWLARDQDNGQICCEVPAVREGQDSLSGTARNSYVHHL